MLDNPYSSMIEMFRQEGAKYNAPDLMLGEVLTEEPNLTIKTGGIQLDKDNLYIADYLLKNYTRKISFKGNANFSGGSVDGNTSSVSVSEHGNHGHRVTNISVSNTLHDEIGNLCFTESQLKRGDLVALQQLSGTNKFVVYCRLKTI